METLSNNVISPEMLGRMMGPEILNEEVCRQLALEILHPQGPRCPGCRAEVIGDRPLASWWALRRVKCKSCGKMFTAATGTILQGIKMDLRQLLLIAWGLTLRLDLKQIADLAGLQSWTVWNWSKRFKG